jgi:multidrug efflux pump subunit AcrA (membrane-fusion protein)
MNPNQSKLLSAMQRSVAQVSNLLYRGFPIRKRSELPKPPDLRTFCRLEVGDTAGWKPALRWKRPAALLAILALLAAFTPAAFAHEGHDKAPGEGGETPATGPIAITAEAKKNLALKVEEAELRALEKTALVFGQIEAIPTREAAVTSRIPGRVSDLKVVDGETVKKGQLLLEVESRQLGDPPPRVQFTAPIDGIVTDLHSRPGGSVEPDAHLMEIVDLTEVYAEGSVFEGQVARVKIGQQVRVYVESFPDEVFTGTVDLVSGALDPETRTLKVMIRVANPDLKLRPNMRARLNIVTAQADSVVTVPLSAVLGEAGHYFIFVQSDADTNGLTFEKRAAVVGMKDDRYAEIVEGVFPTDKVVVDGNYQLQYVAATKPAPKPGESGGTNAPAASAHTYSDADAGDDHAHSQSSVATSPFLWMGLTVALLLLVNAVILLLKRRAPKAAESQSENVGQASSLPVDGASVPRSSGGAMPPEPADKISAPHKA